jgi:hypothetical protein
MLLTSLFFLSIKALVIFAKVGPRGNGTANSFNKEALNLSPKTNILLSN